MTKEQEEAIENLTDLLKQRDEKQVKITTYNLFENIETVLSMLKEKDAKIEHLEEKRNNQKQELAILNEKQKEMNKLINTVNSYKGMVKKLESENKTLKRELKIVDQECSRLIRKEVKQEFEQKVKEELERAEKENKPYEEYEIESRMYWINQGKISLAKKLLENKMLKEKELEYSDFNTYPHYVFATAFLVNGELADYKIQNRERNWENRTFRGSDWENEVWEKGFITKELDLTCEYKKILVNNSEEHNEAFEKLEDWLFTNFKIYQKANPVRW